MRQEIDGRGDLGRDATGQPRSRSLNLDDPGGPLGLPRPVHPAGAVENAKDRVSHRSLDGAHNAPSTVCTGPAPDLSVRRSRRTTRFTKPDRSLATKTGHSHLLSTPTFF